jgi:hypothetical protein
LAFSDSACYLKRCPFFTPYDLPNERKVRIGEPGDGSYVIVDRLHKCQPVMSFGVGPSINFEIGRAARGFA